MYVYVCVYVGRYANDEDVDSGWRTVHLPMTNSAYQQDNNGQPDLLPDNKPGYYSYPGQPYDDKVCLSIYLSLSLSLSLSLTLSVRSPSLCLLAEPPRFFQI